MTSLLAATLHVKEEEKMVSVWTEEEGEEEEEGPVSSLVSNVTMCSLRAHRPLPPPYTHRGCSGPVLCLPPRCSSRSIPPKHPEISAGCSR